MEKSPRQKMPPKPRRTFKQYHHITRRNEGRSHGPRYIKGPPLRSEEKISSPRASVMQSQDNPNDVSHYPCMSRASHPSKGVRLTVPAGDASTQYHSSYVLQQDIEFQYEASQSMGMDMTDPGYWPEDHPVSGSVMSVNQYPFFSGHPGTHDCLHEQRYPPPHPLYPYTPGQLSEGRSVGGNLGPSMVGYADNVSCRDVGPGSEDPCISPRCGTDPGGPIHLTTNISMAFSQVSYPNLIKEVCHYSAWKTR